MGVLCRGRDPRRGAKCDCGANENVSTRLGENVITVIVNGDITQCDPPRGVRTWVERDALERFNSI